MQKPPPSMQCNLADWLQRIEQAHPPVIKLGLTRLKAVAAIDRLTTFSVPVITVTGTNGKGSCIAYLEAILQAAGYCVGAYTSPHLYAFNERLRIKGKPVDDDSWCAAFERIEAAAKQKAVPLTFFEFITLAALYILQQASPDVLLLEVGLGGRLDAVNVVDPTLAIITTIGLDHQNYLGNDRESIGREKAGIFRAGQLAVCGDPHIPNSVIEAAQRLGTKLHTSEKATALSTNKKLLPSAGCALTALRLLAPQLPVSETAIQTGLARAQLKGRFQQIDAACPTIIDVAHNPCAAQWLNQQLQQLPSQGKTMAVFSMLKDKDLCGTIAALKETVDEWFIAPLPSPSSRAATLEALLAAFNALSIKAVTPFSSVALAYKHAVQVATATQPTARIVVFGSFHTVAAIPLAASTQD